MAGVGRLSGGHCRRRKTVVAGCGRAAAGRSVGGSLFASVKQFRVQLDAAERQREARRGAAGAGGRQRPQAALKLPSAPRGFLAVSHCASTTAGAGTPSIRVSAIATRAVGADAAAVWLGGVFNEPVTGAAAMDGKEDVLGARRLRPRSSVVTSHRLGVSGCHPGAGRCARAMVGGRAAPCGGRRRPDDGADMMADAVGGRRPQLIF